MVKAAITFRCCLYSRALRHSCGSTFWSDLPTIIQLGIIQSDILLRLKAWKYVTESNELELKRRTVDLTQLLGGLVETFRIGVEAKAQHLSVEIDPNAITLHTDDLYLGIALAKIVENALH